MLPENIELIKNKQDDYKNLAILAEQAQNLYLTHNVHKKNTSYVLEYTVRAVLLELARVMNSDDKSPMNSLNNIIAHIESLKRYL